VTETTTKVTAVLPAAAFRRGDRTPPQFRRIERVPFQVAGTPEVMLD
jgi:hypothetical protein